ncbi:MAG: ATP-binding protein [Acidobacteriota bacterium]
MRKLYVQIYLTCVGILLLFLLLATAGWLTRPVGPRGNALDIVSVVIGEHLFPRHVPDEMNQEHLEHLTVHWPIDWALHDEDGRRIAAVGEELPEPDTRRRQSGWVGLTSARHALALRLPDGRWSVMRLRGAPSPLAHVTFMLGLFAIAIAIGSFPVVRRITGRLERLQRRVDELGAGNLDVRVKVEGRDEVADLAVSFNSAAERIQTLVGSQARLLAAVSHELRSPLARLRVAAELATKERPDLRDRLSGEIDELDGLIEELLLASRLEARSEIEQRDEIDLLALAAEEASRIGLEAGGESVVLTGEARLLRRAVRNLVENARRHGGEGVIEVSVRREDDAAVLTVADEGPGVPAEERERIFEPFARLRGEDTPGVGLGLALVASIAKQHGGAVSCREAERGGAVFEIELPVGRAEAQLRQSASESRA